MEITNQPHARTQPIASVCRAQRKVTAAETAQSTHANPCATARLKSRYVTVKQTGFVPTARQRTTAPQTPQPFHARPRAHPDSTKRRHVPAPSTESVWTAHRANFSATARQQCQSASPCARKERLKHNPARLPHPAYVTRALRRTTASRTNRRSIARYLAEEASTNPHNAPRSPIGYAPHVSDQRGFIHGQQDARSCVGRIRCCRAQINAWRSQ